MRTSTIYNLVWNRKKVSGPGLIQIEVIFPDRKKKYISTGYKVTKGEWDDANKMIIKHPLANRMNRVMQETIQKLRTQEIEAGEKGRKFSVKDVQAIAEKKSINSLIEFMDAERNKMNVASAVEYLHKRVRDNLKEVGIETFSDLTYNNIESFDLYIKSFLKAQTSVSKQHSVVKTYIHLAQKKGFIDYSQNPYNTFYVHKGKSKIRTRLDDTEIENLIKLDVPYSLQLTKDLFLFCIYTGLSYKDLQNITKANLRADGKDYWIEGLRKKSGEFYSVFLMPDAYSLILKYNGGKHLFPVPEQYVQNRNLKLLGVKAGLSKTLTTHVARHTAASWMLRKGIPIEVIKDILGHQDIDTTQIYAKLEKQTIKEQMLKAFSKTP